MVILGSGSVILLILLQCVHGNASSPGLSLPPCNVTLQTVDLSSILHWECPPMPSNTTFEVHTLEQGKPKWKKVLQCTGMTSSNCDLSQAFSNVDLFNFVRLTRLAPGEGLAWTWERNVDLRSEMVFTAPSLTLSLNGSRLRVDLRFPTSLSRSLCPGNKTCSVAMVMRPMTNITVYQVQQPSELQVLTLDRSGESCLFLGAEPPLHSSPEPLGLCGAPVTLSSSCSSMPLWNSCTPEATGELVSCEFESLQDGLSYCVVASFTSSTTAGPCCISLATRVSVLKSLLLALGICSVLLISAAIVFVSLRFWPSAEPPLPRPLDSLQNTSSRELAGSPEDYAGDHLSVLSVPVSDSSSALPVDTDAPGDDFSLPCGYYDNPLHPDSMAEEDWEESIVHLLDREAEGPCRPPMGSLPACDGIGGPWDIPLCSVRLAPPDAGALQDWINFSGPTGLQEATTPLAECNALGQMEAAVDFCGSNY